MTSRIFPVLRLSLLAVLLLITASPLYAETESIDLIDAYATTPGQAARTGLFDANDQIDLLYEFNVESTETETAHLTWDVYNRYERVAHSGSIDIACEPGFNSIRVENAIPVDIGAGTQTYSIYASVSVDGLKDDVEFEIRIESPPAIPGIHIEDVRLVPRDDDTLSEELGDAAIPYTLEVDFRIENIVSWAHAQIRWIGTTADGFVLDRGMGSTSIDDGFNNFFVDGYLARPPYGSTPEADFSIEVIVLGYYDTVTFPIETLPVSLIQLQATHGVNDPMDFSVGEGYLVTADNARASWFGADESIITRLLTGGIAPENTTVLLRISGGPDEIVEDYTIPIDAGNIVSEVDYILPEDIDRLPGFYDVNWLVVINGILFAERNSSLTISGEQGINVPVVVDLPGDVFFTAPLTWTVTRESEIGLYATIMTQDGLIGRILYNPLDEPINIATLADAFESSESVSGIPSSATLLTSQEYELESEWESVRRAYLGDGKIIINDYWLYRIGDGEYGFLTASVGGSDDFVTEAYEASDLIRDSVSFNN